MKKTAGNRLHIIKGLKLYYVKKYAEGLNSLVYSPNIPLNNSIKQIYLLSYIAKDFHVVVLRVKIPHFYGGFLFWAIVLKQD